MFDQKSLNTLEYPKILDMAAEFAQSESARRAVRGILPSNRAEEVRTLLDETAEADRVLFDFCVNPSFASDDVAEILQKAGKGASLSIAEILKVGRALRVSRRAEKAISSVTEIPLLYDRLRYLYSDETLENRIFSSFISDTEVADTATPELTAIRRRIRKLNESVRQKLQTFITAPAYSKILQDNIVTMRGDRYVIPVKSDCKGAISGLVHDQSASGSTLFIEPMQVVELNNDLKVEKINEIKEIERILRGFSFDIRGVSDSIATSYDTIVQLDVIFSKAQLARSMKAVRPEINDTGRLNIREGRHPLIDAKKVVPVTLSVRDEEKMLLITGPNTGGKTVTLKLAGLFSLMAMSGFYLPAKSADISVFDGVYSDIGDEQSIEQSLSTFSAHIKNIIDILGRMTEKSLVLFDELGAGTDPAEGAALAVAVSEHVLGTRAKALITSHFNDLKEFAITTERVATASMEFDAVTFSPTYKLVMGAIGSSNALDIAKRLGLPQAIIDNARGKISKEKTAFNNVLHAAEETRRRADMLVSEASLDRELAAKALIDAEKERRIVAEKREKLDESIRRETKKLIERSVDEADELIGELRAILDKPAPDESDLFTARKIKKKLQNLSAEYDKESIIEDKPDHSPLNAGDNVWVKSLGKKGRLIKISKRGEAEVRFGTMSVKVKSGDYYKVK